jgi:diguanylate cyclase (GGDEF)-like protein/PAS domain S-box-containing protein
MELSGTKQAVTLGSPRANLVLGIALLGALAACSFYSTSLFHLAAGIAVALVAFSILAMATMLRRFVDIDAYPKFLGIALAFTATLYILRGLSFVRLGSQLGDQGNLTSQLSVAAQYLSTASLLLAPFFIGRRARPWLLVAIYGLLTALLVAAIAWWHIFPVCRLPNGDLTTFKQTSEAVCGTALLGAIVLTWRKRHLLDSVTLRLMIAALCSGALSALVLVAPAQFDEPANVVGQLLFVCAAYLIYVAIGWSGITRPAVLTLADLQRRGQRAEELRRKAVKELRQSEQHRRALIDDSTLGVVVYDRKLVVNECNEAATRILGIAVGAVLGSGASFDDGLAGAARQALQGTASAYEGTYLDSSGQREIWIASRALPLVARNGRISGAMLVVSDVTEHKHAEELIERLAFGDALTGLPNRTLLHDRLRQALAGAARSKRNVAVAVIDLDRFKELNDTIGHSGADTLLQQMATRLGSLVRSADTLARIGGDEFALLLWEVASPRDATVVVEKICAAVREPWEVAGKTIQVTASVGLALYPADAADAHALLENAHSAMRRAKALGRDTYQFYDLTFALQTAERRSLERELRLALTDDQLRVYYQPQVDLADGRIVGVEALVRWQHPQRGLVPPDEFIGLAEETGLIEGLDLFVLGSAASQVAAWQALAGRPLRLAVNVSAKRLQGPALVSSIVATLKQSGLDAAQLEVELTETAIMADIPVALSVLSALRELGLTVALDDFGTGFSSLAHLQQLPITTVKIDRSFVSAVGEDANAATIVSAIAALGRDLGLRIVAEGVETAAQLDFVRRVGCHEAQGYLLAKPLPAHECEALLTASGEVVAAV